MEGKNTNGKMGEMEKGRTLDSSKTVTIEQVHLAMAKAFPHMADKYMWSAAHNQLPTDEFHKGLRMVEENLAEFCALVLVELEKGELDDYKDLLPNKKTKGEEKGL